MLYTDRQMEAIVKAALKSTVMCYFCICAYYYVLKLSVKAGYEKRYASMKIKIRSNFVNYGVY